MKFVVEIKDEKINPIIEKLRSTHPNLELAKILTGIIYQGFVVCEGVKLQENELEVFTVDKVKRK
jgi:hypothetical protein